MMCIHIRSAFLGVCHQFIPLCFLFPPERGVNPAVIPSVFQWFIPLCQSSYIVLNMSFGNKIALSPPLSPTLL